MPFCRHIKLKLRPQQRQFAQTQTPVCRMAATQRQSMQPQPKMLGQSMPPNVGAGMGKSHQTLQPKQQLPPYQQTVMPQKAVN